MIRLLFFAIVLGLSSQNLYASDFSGTWVGVAQSMNVQNKASACREIKFDINQSESVFQVQSGSYHCPSVRTKFKPSQVLIHDEELILHNSSVGTITQSEIKFAQKVGQIYQMRTAFLVGGNMYYTETWSHISSGDRVFYLQAILSRVEL